MLIARHELCCHSTHFALAAFDCSICIQAGNIQHKNIDIIDAERKRLQMRFLIKTFRVEINRAKETSRTSEKNGEHERTVSFAF